MYNAYVYDFTLASPEAVCFYSSVAVDPALAISSPKLTLEKNSAGSFEFEMDPTNIANEYFKSMSSVVEIYKDGNIYWRGRMISEERDCYDRRKILCEGALNFLLDTVQLPMHISGGIRSWLGYLLTNDYHDPDAPEGQYHRCHNYFYSETETYKQFTIAYFDPALEVNEAVDWYADYETTGDLLSNVLEAYDVKMVVKYDNGKTNLYFYKDYPDSLRSQQTIMFGKNLISYTRNWSLEDLATVIIPVGKKYEDSEERPVTPYTPPDLDASATIASINQGSVFLSANDDIIRRYGRIYKKIEWNDISEPENLLDLAENYFSTYQFDKMTIELELYDLSAMMTGEEKEANELHLMGTVRCVSKPHGLDRYFPITKVEIDLNNPADTKFTLGEEDGASTLTGSVANANSSLEESINKNALQQSRIYTEIINKSFEQSTNLMNQFAELGYVSLIHDQGDPNRLVGIVISDSANWKSPTAKLWKWTLGGLGWSENGGSTMSKIAITNDGQINAQCITTGTMYADRIWGGTLQDVTGNTVWNLETGILKSKNLTIESATTPGNTGYLYLSTSNWSSGSASASSYPSGLTINGKQSQDWRLVLGDKFGVDSSGVISSTEFYTGNMLIRTDCIRTIDEALGNSGHVFIGAEDASYIYPNECPYEVAGHSGSDWRITVGANFGVTSGGYLYSRYGNFTSAVVDGALSTSRLSVGSINIGGSRSLNPGTVVDKTAITYNRTIILRVASMVKQANGTVTVTVHGYVQDSSDNYNHQLNGTVPINFYLGHWYQIEWPNPPASYYKGYFYQQPANVIHTINVTSGSTRNNPTVKTISGLSATYAVDICALFTVEHWDTSPFEAIPVWTTSADVMTNGWSDVMYTTFTPNEPYDAILTGCAIAPSGSYYLGGKNHPWKEVYASTATIYTSSRLAKKDITDLPSNFDIFFDQLHPVSFRMKDDEENKKHNGFILDEVGTALNVAGMDQDEFAGYVQFGDDHLGLGGLRYSEFIAINTDQIQKAKKRISELEERIEALERGRNES